ncbi:DUF2530 domain-containing protein [Actinoplanes sp. NPDC051851]|uniref:DUF2530 domain-containing protein n=1 Tax=Actinoplanes sp. NPDC051851 TaxID=3154753 RepID=UPI0034379749
MVPFAIGGIVAFAIGLIVCAVAGAPALWTETCLSGLLLGIPGLTTMIVHDRHRRQRRALSHPEFRVTP